MPLREPRTRGLFASLTSRGVGVTSLLTPHSSLLTPHMLGGTAGYTRGDVLACMGLLVGRQQPGGAGLVTLLPTCHGVWRHRARPKRLRRPNTDVYATPHLPHQAHMEAAVAVVVVDAATAEIDAPRVAGIAHIRRRGPIERSLRIGEPSSVNPWTSATCQYPLQLFLGRHAPIRIAAQGAGVDRIFVANAVGAGINLRRSGGWCHPTSVRCSCCHSWCTCWFQDGWWQGWQFCLPRSDRCCFL